jgi:polyhydroxybutyrate depolymerase
VGDSAPRRVPLLAALAVPAAGLLAACGGGGASSSDEAGAGATRAAATTQAQAASCPAAGLREVQGGLLRVPENAQPGHTPLLVIVIPGGEGDRTDRLGVGAAANRQGVAVLYPTSPGSGFWQLNDEFGTSDVTAVTGLLDREQQTGCFDEDRISITGVSNGAGFAARMACELPGRFAAVVPVAAGYRAPSTRAPPARGPRSSPSTEPPTRSSRSTASAPTARATSRATPPDGHSVTAARPPRA